MNLTDVWLALRSLMTRGTVVSVDDHGPRQLVTADLLAGEQRICDAVGQFGLAAVPPVDSEVLVAKPDGQGGDLIVIASQWTPARPVGLPAGATALYCDGSARVRLADGNVTVTGSIRLEGDVTITGQLIVGSGARKVARDGDAVSVGDRVGTIRVGSGARAFVP